MGKFVLTLISSSSKSHLTSEKQISLFCLTDDVKKSQLRIASPCLCMSLSLSLSFSNWLFNNSNCCFRGNDETVSVTKLKVFCQNIFLAIYLQKAKLIFVRIRWNGFALALARTPARQFRFTLVATQPKVPR